jgi:hypothetical protein
MVVLHVLPGLEGHHLGRVRRAAEVGDALEVELLQDAGLADDVNLL